MDFEKSMFEEVKFKKKLEYLSNLAIENQELKESIKSLTSTVEVLQDKVDNLQKALNEKVDGENILEAIVYAIEEVKELD
ncbi:hypothetical protein [Bacillus paramycoides]|uniref:hypothetical protein n=1 Tax=Bacillus paramycoides TaxID=2026194 RepID=UPI002E231382|nr:hypothetical protein [Bacillus paramycoides]